MDEMEDDKYFRYLDDLRESGVTNMFGAPAYLEREFNLGKAEAKAIWVRWTENFAGDAS